MRIVSSISPIFVSAPGKQGVGGWKEGHSQRTPAFRAS
jgi:hypothetical protein